MLRAIIVDDEELSLKRLNKILSESGEIEICDSFLNPLEAYEFVKSNQVHVVFLDISMPEIDGMRLSSLLLELDASIDVVFVTGYDDYAVQAFDINALDYLMKPVSSQRMSKTLDKLKKRHRITAVEPFIEARSPVTQIEELSSTEILTDQEKRILRLITDGLSNKEIANHLNIKAETVKSHIKNLYRKLNVNNRVQALQRAKEWLILV
ncbi:DNA-binding response regulator [Paenibacillus radicis (ex Xue et al. 2023)]|uniref:DNA-binding response regulator n=1 Tax=Paenibacillus radicis (ex Xue et al. 2023) TaxID=2972489 RepID=A0ABT1YG75_9BACL|nr:DNA-binding response regulator [Paenibacillus radicis (ex Xue et al. 2023)]MCR8630960.1 DNA-binding response regulator [Paenibacillus radicis (ex Xue et al. 2023)]